MSIKYADYKREMRRGFSFCYKLTAERSLDRETLRWLSENGKSYRSETLDRFEIHKGTLQVYDMRFGSGARAFVYSDPCVIIPVPPINRCYRFMQPKKDRWRVVPAGYPAQWLGDLSCDDLILVEGEWDFLRLQDEGFTNAITHTAGAGTWLLGWTPLFANKRVWICYDRDSIGQMGATKVAEMLSQVAREVRLVDLPLPGTPVAKDVSDFFRLGGDRDEFGRLLEHSRFYIPKRKASFH